jgi:hypothetical protein
LPTTHIEKIIKGQILKKICPALYSRWDLNPYGPYSPLDFKSRVPTNSTTRALE